MADVHWHQYYQHTLEEQVVLIPGKQGSHSERVYQPQRALILKYLTARTQTHSHMVQSSCASKKTSNKYFYLQVYTSVLSLQVLHLT